MKYILEYNAFINEEVDLKLKMTGLQAKKNTIINKLNQAKQKKNEDQVAIGQLNLKKNQHDIDKLKIDQQLQALKQKIKAKRKNKLK